MSVYAADKLIAQARILAAEYRRTMGKPLPGISTEIAEHDAKRLLSLQEKQDDTAGYDAVDRSGRKIQIKSRTLFDDNLSGQRIGQIKMDQVWDAVVLVLMDEDYSPYEIYQAERNELIEYAQKSSSKRAKRGALSIARFKIIGQLIWTREEGLEPEIWDNQS